MAAIDRLSIPFHSRWVPASLEKILDQKIQGVALGCLKSLVHWLCKLLYFPYQNLYKLKKSRVFPFVQGDAPLIDYTRGGIARLEVVKVKGVHGLGVVDANWICIQGRKVLKHLDGKAEPLLFQASLQNSHIAVEDVGKDRVCIYDTSSQERWEVAFSDTSFVNFQQHATLISEEEVYYARLPQENEDE